MRIEAVKPFVLGLLALQAVAVALVWLLDAYSEQSTAAFALLLAADVMAFAIVAHVYRVARTGGPSSGPPSARPAVAAAASAAAGEAVRPPSSESRLQSALPRAVHYAAPILSVLILLAFAATTFFPSNTGALPVQSTVLFVPIYLAIVVFLVFASMYIFKAVVERDGFRD